MHFPPKNRPTQSDLGVIDIEISDAVARLLLKPHEAVMMAATGELDGHFFAKQSIGPSDIDGEPGFGYRTNQVQMILTGEQIKRLCMFSLMPTEVKALLEKYGDFHEVHDDFYCHDTFEALQPVDEDDYQARRMAERP